MATLTELDVKSVEIILPLLIEQAKKGETITYSKVNAALAHENVEQGSDQIIGRRLERIRCFTNPKNLPDLSSLVVREDTENPGDAYDDEFEKTQAECFACKDWREGEKEVFLTELGRMIGKETHEVFKHFGAGEPSA